MNSMPIKNKKTSLKWDCKKDGHLFEKFCWTEETTVGKTHHIVKICTACNKKI